MDFLNRLFDTNLQNDIIKQAQGEIKENVAQLFGNQPTVAPAPRPSVYDQKEVSSGLSFDMSAVLPLVAIAGLGYIILKKVK
jgi:hypothetical protein